MAFGDLIVASNKWCPVTVTQNPSKAANRIRCRSPGSATGMPIRHSVLGIVFLRIAPCPSCFAPGGLSIRRPRLHINYVGSDGQPFLRKKKLQLPHSEVWRRYLPGSWPSIYLTLRDRALEELHGRSTQEGSWQLGRKGKKNKKKKKKFRRGNPHCLSVLAVGADTQRCQC
ncbi:hypothetical protein LX36DRAFT_421505 [Colletotrichum falcatum]|nr:hypothetical protein LX36DRAFT_421505 [Colletotrichum falcatum]